MENDDLSELELELQSLASYITSQESERVMPGYLRDITPQESERIKQESERIMPYWLKDYIFRSGLLSPDNNYSKGILIARVYSYSEGVKRCDDSETSEGEEDNYECSIREQYELYEECIRRGTNVYTYMPNNKSLNTKLLEDLISKTDIGILFQDCLCCNKDGYMPLIEQMERNYPEGKTLIALPCRPKVNLDHKLYNLENGVYRPKSKIFIG